MIKKIFSIFSIFLAISIITFFLVKLAPGDPAKNYLRASHVSITEENLIKTREELGLNKSYISQYLSWSANIIKGNFGISYIKKVPVISLIKEAIVPTFQLGIISFFLLILTAPLFGILSAMYKNKFLDYLIQFFTYIGISIPTFWIGYILIIIFSVSLKILPVSGRGTLKHFILPSITLVLPLIAQTIFFIRKTILEEMEKPHFENAIIRGIKKEKLIFNHLLKNCSIPIITVLSSNIMYVLTGSVLIEEIFSWPGIGRLFATAVKTGDLPLIQIQLLFFGLMSIIVNEITQIIIKNLDPKQKLNEGVIT